MDELREIFAKELEREGERHLAAAVRTGTDNSRGGTAAIRAIRAAVEAEREACAGVAEGHPYGWKTPNAIAAAIRRRTDSG